MKLRESIKEYLSEFKIGCTLILKGVVMYFRLLFKLLGIWKLVINEAPTSVIMNEIDNSNEIAIELRNLFEKYKKFFQN
jgi:hypothetical protein